MTNTTSYGDPFVGRQFYRYVPAPPPEYVNCRCAIATIVEHDPLASYPRGKAKP